MFPSESHYALDTNNYNEIDKSDEVGKFAGTVKVAEAACVVNRADKVDEVEEMDEIMKTDGLEKPRVDVVCASDFEITTKTSPTANDKEIPREDETDMIKYWTSLLLKYKDYRVLDKLGHGSFG